MHLGIYKSLDVFFDDVSLVFRNCFEYNEGGSALSTMAAALAHRFVDAYRRWIKDAVVDGNGEWDLWIHQMIELGCAVCKRSHYLDTIIICDGCGIECHYGCIGLDRIPEADEWFCPSCASKSAREFVSTVRKPITAASKPATAVRKKKSTTTSPAKPLLTSTEFKARSHLEKLMMKDMEEEMGITDSAPTASTSTLTF